MKYFTKQDAKEIFSYILTLLGASLLVFYFFYLLFSNGSTDKEPALFFAFALAAIIGPIAGTISFYAPDKEQQAKAREYLRKEIEIYYNTEITRFSPVYKEETSKYCNSK